MNTCHGVRLHNSMMVEGRKVPVSMYYAGRGKDGRVQTNTKPHNAALMTEALANLLVAKLNSTGHHSELCELLCDENSTIHDNMVGLGEEAAPVAVPTSLQELGKAIENCFHRDHLSPLESLNHCNKTVLLG